MTRDQANQSEPGQITVKKRRQRSGRPSVLLLVCTLLYASALLGVSAANMSGPERWWFGSLNLYLPQWPWALPCMVIFPWYLMSAWRWAWVPALMMAWVFGPLMGFSFGPARIAPRPSGTRLRVMTYNVKWGFRDADAVLANVAQANPDVILMQDSAGATEGKLAALRKPGWSELRLDQYTVLSRYPLAQPAAQWLTPEHDHECLRCVLRIGSRDVTLYDVHLITPRWALGSFADNSAEGTLDIEQNANLRELEAFTLAGHIPSEKGPLILTGDLNAPVQSGACKSLFRAGLRDAYSEAGWGYGYTYGQSTALERPYMRIDHIMVSREWAVLNCREGASRGSDHSPVIADLVLPDSP
jgi:vancomycin resistance protein VanJ